MGTNEKTLESLARIREAIKVLKAEEKTLSLHIGVQKRQIAWNNEGKHKHKSINLEKC